LVLKEIGTTVCVVGHGPLIVANIMKATLFGASHVLICRAIADQLVGAPAVTFGWFWEDTKKRIAALNILHSWFNFCLAWASR
jgi:hypothetical protein